MTVSDPAREHASNDADTPAVRASILAGVSINTVPFDAPWAWLAAGWRDLWSVPSVSLTYGALFAAGAVLMLFGLVQFGAQSLMLALAGGFLLIGPLVAVGLYEASRRLEAGEAVTMGGVAFAGLRAEGQLSFLGLILLMIFLIWLQLAFLLFMLFTGARSIPPAAEFVPMLLFTPHGLGLLVFGTMVGGVLALVVYAVSAVSVPLLMQKRIDAMSAVDISYRTVRANPKAMLLWAVLIAGFIALGIATLGAGLVIAFPLIGHATWHAYRDLIATE